jgi:hypothetical protein
MHVSDPPSPVASTESTKPAKQKVDQAEEARFQKVAIAVRIVKSSMRDPDSFKLEFAGSNESGSVICMTYRAKNGFGGYNKEQVSIVDGRLSEAASQWNRNCAHKDLYDMSHVKYAL